jgi:hypothetical protein
MYTTRRLPRRIDSIESLFSDRVVFKNMKGQYQMEDKISYQEAPEVTRESVQNGIYYILMFKSKMLVG